MLDIFKDSLVPKMISNSSPEPFKCSASSAYSQFDVYRMFSRTNDSANDCWHSYSVSYPHWVCISLDSPRIVNKMVIQARNTTSISYLNTPSKFELHASNDEENWKVIFSKDKLVYNFSEIKVFEFDNINQYKYYKLVIYKSYGNNYACIANLGLFENQIKEDTNVESVVNVNSCFNNKTVPMNTSKNILAKSNDYREGLLGMANDILDYGDLYVAGKDGKSHLTINSKVNHLLFSGKIKEENILLYYNINKFKLLIFNLSIDSSKNIFCELIINKDCIDNLITLRCYEYDLEISFIENNVIKIINNDNNVFIKEIYGYE